MTLFSDKTKASEKITLVEGDTIFTRYAKKTKILNTSFFQTVRIPERESNFQI